MFASDLPVQLATSYMPLVIAGSGEIEARQPRPVEAEFLGLTEAQYVLEGARIAYAEDDVPIETVINVFPSQQWRLSCEWPARWGTDLMADLPRHTVSVTTTAAGFRPAASWSWTRRQPMA
jgi:hypothetical protein